MPFASVQNQVRVPVMASHHNGAVRNVLIHDMSSGAARMIADQVAVESPLEVRLAHFIDGAWSEKTICVTMRTPGEDEELVIGFLFAEGAIESIGDIHPADGETGAPDAERQDVITVRLSTSVSADVRRLERNVFTTSSCGVCGAPSLDALAYARCRDLPTPRPMVDPNVVHLLPAALHKEQTTFRQTGGLHAVALFDRQGRLLRVREDVGRHNAMDKLIGSCLRDDLYPLDEYILLVSGRASYELVQKALRAGVPILAAVGAPSSLAIELAQAHDLTLLGFVREGRYNIYHGANRLRRMGTHCVGS